MGRTPLSDQEKIRRGTLDDRSSEGARAKERMNTVLAFPALKQVPKPTFLLREKGREQFDFWCRKLLDAGLLTRITVGEIENLALVADKIQSALDQGKNPSGQDINLRRLLLTKLESLNVDTSFFAAAKNKSAFAQNGFPSRLRSPAEHQARRAG
jgi:hypothetical protein